MLLGVFFVALYLLTMGGHFDSPDEEVMFRVTRSLAERGSLNVDNPDSPEQLQTGVDGRSYAHYGVVTSLLGVPLYVLGRGTASLLPAGYAEVVERFAVALRGPLISAAACLLFYAVAVEFGFGTRVAVALTLAFGGATLVWPFAKYSWSEPVTGFWLLLAVLAALRTVHTGSTAALKWSGLSSVALGLAIGSKIATAIAVPILLVYLFGAGAVPLRSRVKRCIPFVAVLVVPGIGFALLNMARFGNPLDAGYYLEGYFWHPIGIAGLLLSPSKSLFLFAPVALLGLAGFTRLATKLPWESGLLFALAAVHVLLYGGLVFWWHGDASWGPRYLVPVVPFVVLPVGALLAWTGGLARRLAWGAFTVLVGAGILVNVGGVLVDQRVSFVYLLQTAAGGDLVRMENQRWNLALSPVWIHWNELGRRVSAYADLLSQPVSLVSGTYPKEAVDPVDAEAAAQSAALFPRWMSGAAVFELNNHGQPAELTLEYLDNRPSSLGVAVVQVLVDGTPVPDADITCMQSAVALPDKRLPWVLEAKLDRMVTGHDSVTVELRTQTWRAPQDVRDLGVQIWDLRFRSNGHELPIGEALLSPMPVTAARPWSFELETWFYAPPWHLADVWLWYLYLSGLPRWLMLLGLLPAVGLAWSSVQLWRFWRRVM